MIKVIGIREVEWEDVREVGKNTYNRSPVYLVIER